MASSSSPGDVKPPAPIEAEHYTHGATYPATPFGPAFEKGVKADLHAHPPTSWHEPTSVAPTYHSVWQSGVRIPLAVLLLLALVLVLETSVITLYTAVALYATLPAHAVLTHQSSSPIVNNLVSTVTQTSVLTSISTTQAAPVTVSVNVTVTATPPAVTPKIEFSTIDSTKAVPNTGVVTKTLQ